MKKKLICGILAALMACTFAGCGGGEKPKAKPAAPPVASVKAGEKTVDIYEYTGADWTLIKDRMLELTRNGNQLYFLDFGKQGNKAILYQATVEQETLKDMKAVVDNVVLSHGLTLVGKNLYFVQNGNLSYYDGKAVHQTDTNRSRTDDIFTAAGKDNEIYRYYNGKQKLEKGKLENGKFTEGATFLTLPSDYGRTNGKTLVAEKDALYFQFDAKAKHQTDVYDNKGKLRYTIDTGSYAKNIVVTSHYVVVPDKKKNVKIYDKKDGKEIGECKLPKLEMLSATAAGDDSIIFSDISTKKIYRADIH